MALSELEDNISERVVDFLYNSDVMNDIIESSKADKILYNSAESRDVMFENTVTRVLAGTIVKLLQLGK